MHSHYSGVRVGELLTFCARMMWLQIGLQDELSIHPHSRVYATLGRVPNRCSVVWVRSGGCFEHTGNVLLK